MLGQAPTLKHKKDLDYSAYPSQHLMGWEASLAFFNLSEAAILCDSSSVNTVKHVR